MILSTAGFNVLPRNCRSKLVCASSTVTRTPSRASMSPSTTPAGPPPTTQHSARRVRGVA